MRGAIDRQELILLIHQDSASPGLVRQALASQGGSAFRLQCVASLPTALARIAGGDVDAVLLDLSQGGGPDIDRLDSILKLRHEAPNAPIVVLCGAEDEGLALVAQRAGVTDYVIKERCQSSLTPALRAAIERRLKPAANGLAKASLKGGEVIVLLGAKGGVGTTTVAMNVAAVLAERSKVVLFELRPAFGTLAPYFRAIASTRNLSHLLRAMRGGSAAADVETFLWPCKNVPGLRVLFGPQTVAESGDIEPDFARTITQALAAAADYVVIDLPVSLSGANRSVIEKAKMLVLVTERDPVSVHAAKQMSLAIESLNASPEPPGTVIVNRTHLAVPMPLAEIEAQLTGAVLAVIPPDADLCLSAQNAHMPLVSVVPESLLASSLAALAAALAPSPLSRTRTI
jgi:pilus assembly protein CpaE